MWQSARPCTGSDRSRLQPPSAVSVAVNAWIVPSSAKPTFHSAWKPCRLPEIVMSWVRLNRTPNRAAGDHRAERRDGRIPVRLHLLAAETAAHAQALHGDLVVRLAQHVRHDVLRLGRMLRRGLDEDLPVLVDAGQRRVGLQIEMLLPGELELAFEDVRAAREGGLRFAAAQHGPRTLVALRGDGLLDRDQRRQRLVFDGDLGGPDPGRLEGFGEHPAHRVAVIHDLAGEQRLVVLDPRVVHPWHVGSGEHVHHPRRGQGRRGVHRPHMGVRVRGLHRVGVKCARVPADQVIRVEGETGDVQIRALVRHFDADHRARRTGAEFTHDVAPSGTADSAWNLSSDCSSIAARKAALARWSSIGVPSRPSSGGGLPHGVGGPRAAAQRVFGPGGPQRRCRHPTEADGHPLDDTVGDVQRECDCDA